MERLGFRPFWTEPNLVYVHLTASRRPDLTEVCIKKPPHVSLVTDHPPVCEQYSLINIRGNHEIIIGDSNELGPQ